MAPREPRAISIAKTPAMKPNLVIVLVTAPFCASWVLYSPFAEPYSKDQTKWLNPSSFDLAEQVARWDQPTDVFSDSALGGGIAWALSPNFCENLLPMFPEEPFGNDADASDYASENPGLKFITCHELHDAIARAFNTWSNNNKMIKFTDVTEQCKDDPDVNEGSCAYAEFVIMPDLAYAEEKGLAAYVEMRMVRQSAPAVHMTSGAAMSQAIVVRPSTMHVRATGICWYLDTTFCYQIFRWQNVGGLDVITLMRAVVSFLVIAAVGMLTWVLVQLARAVCCPKAAGIKRTSSAEASLGRRTEGGTKFRSHARCEAVLHYLAKMPVGMLLLSLFILVFTPIFYFKVFLPCWDCYDFEATIAHEVGHLLGFQHPDQFPDANLRAVNSSTTFGDAVEVGSAGEFPARGLMNNATCHDPMNHIELAALPEGLDTIMMSTTKHRERTCLTDDDLEGLNFLYPTCAGAQAKPNCIKRLRHSGWLRLAVAVAIPYLTCTIIIMLIQCAVKYHQKRRLHEMEIRNKKIKGEARQLEGHLQRMPTWMQMQAAGIGDVIPGFGRGSFQNRRGSGRMMQRKTTGCQPTVVSEASASASASAARAANEDADLQRAIEASRVESGKRPTAGPPSHGSAVDLAETSLTSVSSAASPAGRGSCYRSGKEPNLATMSSAEQLAYAMDQSAAEAESGRSAGSVSIEVASPFAAAARSPPKSKPAKPQPAGSGFVDFGALGGGQQDI